MSADLVEQFFLSKMVATYSPPWDKRNDVKAQKIALGEYLHALNDFDAEALQAGWRAITRGSHLGQNWPPIGLCVQVCSAARQPVGREYWIEKQRQEREAKPKVLQPNELAKVQRGIQDAKARGTASGAALARVGQAMIDNHFKALEQQQ